MRSEEGSTLGTDTGRFVDLVSGKLKEFMVVPIFLLTSESVEEVRALQDEE